MKDRKIKDAPVKGTIPKKEMKKAVKKVSEDRKESAPVKKDKKAKGDKDDEHDNSVGSKTRKADGKPRKK